MTTAIIIIVSVLLLVACVAAAAMIKGYSRVTPPLPPMATCPEPGAVIRCPPTDRKLTPEEMQVLLDTYRKANVNIAAELVESRRRFHVLLGLHHRLRNVDDLSPAARPHELRALDAELSILCPPAPTRRIEP